MTGSRTFSITSGLTVALLALAGCGGSTATDRPAAAQAPAGTPAATAGRPAPTTSQQPATAASHAVAVYYLHDTGRRLALYREFHALPKTSGVIRQAVEAMLHSPATDPDYRSLWPAATQVRGVTVSGDTATVDLSAAAKAGSAGAEGEALSVQQLVWTVTAAAPSVHRVRLLVDGQQVNDLWGHGVGSQPLSRAAQEDVLGPVWVLGPAQGATVASPVKISGQATVFEATVSWQVRKGSAGGAVVASGYATATEGAPGRGTWATTVRLPAGSYLLRAFAASAEDGSEQFVDDKAFTVR